LQKTLAQVGLHNGSFLIKLRFTATDQPLGEALTQIGQYFKEDEPEEKSNGVSKEVEAVSEGVSKLDSNDRLAGMLIVFIYFIYLQEAERFRHTPWAVSGTLCSVFEDLGGGQKCIEITCSLM